MRILIINKSKHQLPEYQSLGAAAFDLRANIEKAVVLNSLERTMIPTGVFAEIPEGFEAQIRPRSGLAARHGISIVNSPGTIDSDYRGEWMVVLVNLSKDPYTIGDGDRIAQAVVTRHERVKWHEVDVLDETVRGEGGMGHTGK